MTTDPHPAVHAYDAMDSDTAAAWWYERAMESAREANQLRDQMRGLPRWVRRRYLKEPR